MGARTLAVGTPLRRSRRRALFAALVITPLIGLALLGWELARRDAEVIEHRFQELMAAQLRDVDRSIGRRIELLRRHLLQVTAEVVTDTISLRDLVHDDPWIEQVLVLDDGGARLHPPQDGEMTAAEAALLNRLRPLLDDGGLHRAGRVEEESTSTDSLAARGSALGHGWLTRFWDDGLHLLFWRLTADGLTVAVVVDRMQLLSTTIAELPHAGPGDPTLDAARIVLADSGGAALYQWGGHEPTSDESPRAQHRLTAPLSSWSLRYHAPDSALARPSRAAALGGVAAVAVALLGLATYVYREYDRDMREAQRRVSFVSQVSHELRTPLTNIRMYADLLKSRLDGTLEPKDEQHLAVIVAESERLGRLLETVLTFSRSQRGGLRLRPAPGRVSDVIDRVILSFRPALADKGVRIERGGDRCDELVRLDADALEQVLGNLFSNVEKYASTGGLLQLDCTQHLDRAGRNGTTTVRVRDAGPGVPATTREAIFEPFHRLDDTTAASAAGTGIGLTIARELATLHGGGLEAEAAESGACFALTLQTPPADQPESTT